MEKLNNAILVLFLCLVVMFVFNHGSKQKNTAERATLTGKSTPNRLVVAQEYPASVFDPALAADTGSIRVIANVFEGLVRFKPGTAQVEPCLARSWDVSDDGLTWTFHLRRNVRFHDGTPFDAAAVQFNVTRSLQKYEGSTTYADFVYAPVDKVETVDRYTVRFHLKYPYAPLPNNLAAPMAASMVSPATARQAGVLPAGTGPFKLGGIRDGGVLVVANSTYWGEPPGVDEVLFVSVPDTEQRAEMLLTGQADIALDLAFAHASRLRLRGYPVFRTTGLDIGYLGFYTDRKPFNRPNLRRAVAATLDREQIFRQLWFQNVQPARGTLPPAVLGYDVGTQQAGYDPGRAAELMREAGCGDGFSFTLLTYTDPRPYSPGGGKMLADAVAQALGKEGINVKIQAYPWQAFKQALNRREGDAFLYGWISDNGDPDNFLYTLLTQSQIENGLNITRYHNARLETLLVSARNATDAEIRQELYTRAQEIINKDVPWVVLNHSLHYAAASPFVHGFILNPTGWHNLSGVKKHVPQFP